MKLVVFVLMGSKVVNFLSVFENFLPTDVPINL